MVVNVTPSKFDLCLISGFLFNFACVTANYWPPPSSSPSGNLIQSDPLRVVGANYPPSAAAYYPPNYQTSPYSPRLDPYGSRYVSTPPNSPPPQGYGYSYGGPPPTYYGYSRYDRYGPSTMNPYYRPPPPPPSYGNHIPPQYWRTPGQSYDQFDRRGGSGYPPPVSGSYGPPPPVSGSYGPPPTILPPHGGPYGPPSYATEPPRVAIAKLKSAASKVEGEVRFVQHDRYVGITGRVTGLTPGAHGLHIHEGKEKEGGSCDPALIGKHLNPQHVDHGGKSEWTRHVGDLGNIFADYHGIAYFSITDNLISLFGPHMIVNRTVVVTELGDDLGKGIKDSKINGNAGKPLACGLITLISPQFS